MTGQDDARDALAIFDRIITAASPDDPTRHLPGCGYTDEVPECGCAVFGSRIMACVREIAADHAAALAAAKAEGAREALLAAAESWADLERDDQAWREDPEDWLRALAVAVPTDALDEEAGR